MTPNPPTPSGPETAEEWAELIVDNGEAGLQARIGDVYSKELRGSFIKNAEKQIKRIQSQAREKALGECLEIARDAQMSNESVLDIIVNIRNLRQPKLNPEAACITNYCAEATSVDSWNAREVSEETKLQIAKYIHHEILGHEKWPTPECTQCLEATLEIIRLLKSNLRREGES